VVGDFTSLTLLEVDYREAGAFSVRARRVQGQLWEDLDRRLVGGVRVLREMARRGRQTSFPVVFTSTIGQNLPEELTAGEATGEVVYSITQTPQVWLDHQVAEEQGALLFNWDAVEALFPPHLLDDLFDAYCTLLLTLAADPDAWQLPRFDLLPARQKARRAQANATAAPLPTGLLHDGFLAQAARQPDHPALVTAERTLSYSDLLTLATHHAHLLREAGVQPNALVAVRLPRSWPQIVAVLAVSLAGGAYLPIDVSWPPARVQTVLMQAAVRLAFAEEPLPADLDIRVFSIASAVCGNGLSVPPASTRPEDLAYVLYTSGSTGTPKGVALCHRAALNTLCDINTRFGLAPSDRVLGLSSLSFDLSVWDIFGTLAAGATLVLPASPRDPAAWLAACCEHGVSVWNSVPALLGLLAEYAQQTGRSLPASLRLILLSGDWVPVPLVRSVQAQLPTAQLVSLGGATEAAVWSIFYPLCELPSEAVTVPYGRPLANQRFAVRDRQGQDCPEWVAGELYILGSGLAEGYYNDPEKTAEHFLVEPGSGERCYRTGDLGRYLPSGDIEFLGRVDQQVKLHGQRIELGEVEAVLSAVPGVVRVVCAVAGERLVAFYQSAAGASVSAEALRSAARERLPGSMVPVGYEEVERIALTANGKVDRQALVSQKSVPQEVRQSSAAAGEVSSRFAALVAEVLGIAEVGVEANLLEMGADSVSVIRIANRVEQETGWRPGLEALYRNPTVAALAEAYTRAGASQKAAPALVEPTEREGFKKHRLGVRADRGGQGVHLAVGEDGRAFRERTLGRRSHRRFSIAPLPLARLSDLLYCLAAIPGEDEAKYLYPSAGSSYAVQTYLHIRSGRVAGLAGGTYYYHPLDHRLVPLVPDAVLPADIHDPFVNRPVFQAAAFSVFLVAEMKAIAPLYGDRARDFCLLEAGYTGQLLMSAAPECRLGLCPVGDCDFERIRKLFDLTDSHLLVHSLLGGSIDFEADALWEEIEL
jgi:amino acid adenylation domain-containing protein